MKIPRPVPFVLNIYAFAVLAGCSLRGAGDSASPASAAAQVQRLASLSLASHAADAASPDSGTSWIYPDIDRKAALLYVSDWATNDVFIYNLQSRKPVGHLTALHAPYGQCVDTERHVWIAEFGRAALVEFAHGSKTPIKELPTDGYPIGCSVDATTGNLAVANFATQYGPGNLQVWKGGGSTPTTYHPSKLYYLWPPAYDGDGNLFVEGQVRDGPFGFSELPKGAPHLRAMLLTNATIHYAGAALWDGKHLALTDQDFDGRKTTAILRTIVTGTTGRVVGRTDLTDSCDRYFADVVQPFVMPAHGSVKPVVLGANLRCSARFDFWSYPEGGKPVSTLSAPKQPYGQSVSPGA